MGGMEAYPRGAVERAMKVQEVMLRAMARKITWYQAAEILGITDRHLRRWRERYEQFGFDGELDRRGCPASARRGRGGTLVAVGLRRGTGPGARPAEREAGAGGNGGAGAGLVSGAVLRFQRAAFSREAGRAARHRAELHLGEGGTARGGAGGAGTQARGAPQTAPAAAAARHAAAHRWQPASVVSGRALARPAGDSGRCHQRDLLRPVGGGRMEGDGDGRAARGD